MKIKLCKENYDKINALLLAVNGKAEEHKMSKQKYLHICLQQSPEWLRQCYESPTLHMRQIHLKLVAIAYRRLLNKKF